MKWELHIVSYLLFLVGVVLLVIYSDWHWLVYVGLLCIFWGNNMSIDIRFGRGK